MAPAQNIPSAKSSVAYNAPFSHISSRDSYQPPPSHSKPPDNDRPTKRCGLSPLCKGTAIYVVGARFSRTLCGPPRDHAKCFLRDICVKCRDYYQGPLLEDLRLCYNDKKCQGGGIFLAYEQKFTTFNDTNTGSQRRLCSICTKDYLDRKGTSATRTNTSQTLIVGATTACVPRPSVDSIRRGNIDAQRGSLTAPVVQSLPQIADRRDYVDIYRNAIGGNSAPVPPARPLSASMPPPPLPVSGRQGYSDQHRTQSQEEHRYKDLAFAGALRTHTVEVRSWLVRLVPNKKLGENLHMSFVPLSGIPVTIGTRALHQLFFDTLCSGGDSVFSRWLASLPERIRDIIPYLGRDNTYLSDHNLMPYADVDSFIPKFFEKFFKPPPNAKSKSSNQAASNSFGTLGQFKQPNPPLTLNLVIRDVISERIEKALHGPPPELPQELDPEPESGDDWNSYQQGATTAMAPRRSVAVIVSKAKRRPTTSTPAAASSDESEVELVQPKTKKRAAPKSKTPTDGNSSGPLTRARTRQAARSNDKPPASETLQSPSKPRTGRKAATGHRSSEPLFVPDENDDMDMDISVSNAGHITTNANGTQVAGYDMEININQLSSAIERQVVGLDSSGSAFGQWKTIGLLIMKAKALPLQDLITLGSDEDLRVRVLSPPTFATLSFSGSQKQMYGGFKVAWLGTASPSVFSDTNVCIKQAFEAQPIEGKPHAVAAKLLTGLTQYHRLEMEVLSMTWGATLLTQCIEYCKAMEARGTVKSIPLPDVRFAECALAVAAVNMTPRSGGPYFMLEEVVGGCWRKFKDNRSVLTLPNVHDEDRDLADWLSFTQHCQYQFTQKMAFIADYQGNDRVLTDPQIITHPALSYTFAGGNNPDCYWEMEVWHECNRYCKHYQLIEDWDAIPKAPVLVDLEKQMKIVRPNISRE
ncbi:hypothetical protein PM082_018896 [Marasmius tenuissimus]|nr:hypothetical protein PM082_018896 [Marasmius tenuissimus]